MLSPVTIPGRKIHFADRWSPIEPLQPLQNPESEQLRGPTVSENTVIGPQLEALRMGSGETKSMSATHKGMTLSAYHPHLMLSVSLRSMIRSKSYSMDAGCRIQHAGCKHFIATSYAEIFSLTADG